MKLRDLNSLLRHELKDSRNAEEQLTTALPEIAKIATNDDLRQAFEHRLERTETQIKCLDEVFAELAELDPGPPRAKSRHHGRADGRKQRPAGRTMSLRKRIPHSDRQ